MLFVMHEDIPRQHDGKLTSSQNSTKEDEEDENESWWTSERKKGKNKTIMTQQND